MKRAYIDANIVIRYLTDEPWEMAREVETLLKAAERGEVILVLDEITVAEVVWVLSSFYKASKVVIKDNLLSFIGHEGVEMADEEGVLLALTLYADLNVDFADALLSVRMFKDGVPDLITYDKHFDRLPGVQRVSPKEFLAGD